MNTKTIKVADATNTQLDWLVAKCEGHEWRCPWLLEKEGYTSWMSYEMAWGNPTPSYATDPAQMWPIIEREKICLKHGKHIETWAYIYEGDGYAAYTTGPTALVAAALCYVVSKLGETAEVPEELT